MKLSHPTEHPDELNGTTALTPVSDQIIDSLVAELNELHGQATLEVALKMGAIIVNRFYGGDMRAWREHRAKEASFRKLAARADRDLSVSATTLYRAVALYELTQRLHIGGHSSLSMTHLRAVVGLPEPAQESLLELAQTERWPVERLEREARRIRSLAERTPGRPPSPPLVLAVRKLVRNCQGVETVLHQEDLGCLSRGELKSLYEALSQVRGQVEIFARRIAGTGDPRRS
jgi:hypothetical protein